MYVDITLDEIIEYAMEVHSSDIHFDPMEDGIHVRLRLDGLLQDYMTIGGADADLLTNRIKVFSGMDISEKRLPQDGRWDWCGKQYAGTMRVSSLPSLYGETIVCRLMGNAGVHKTLRELGMPAELECRIEQLLNRPYGLIVICGPTGSGKTSTLYAMLRLLHRKETKLICLEDPVESPIEGAIQIGINEKIGFTFSKGLRAVLRQDPDSIMIGEIRDNETAQLAVKAALTGHRVLTTVHTNTAIGVVSRLIDMGVEPYLLRATLIGSLSQRLVRRLVNSGQYKGRMGLFEYLEIPTTAMDWNCIDDYVVVTLQESAKQAIEAGYTSNEEVRRAGIFY
ncbi:GspE/PulE family protein [Veillonella caviae]|uniref:GspE/PulE family protein n=1 Tax=Veillonella caviae TaxID=248316 RepID=UPI0023F90362|nr:GspE/PulE family protein [Veillonella caviae]